MGINNTEGVPPMPSGALTEWTLRPMSYMGTVSITLLLGYLLLVSSLRFQREKQMRKRFNYPNRESFKAMTNEDAFAIQNYLAELEFPTVFEKSLEFALFKTYGIGTIAALLVATKQLSSGANVTKRYSDTVVLIAEFVANPPTSERALTALSRMNYIHEHYQKQGKISNSDMLYTLGLFALEPARWINQYEWRQLNEMEICALGTFWKSIGDAMGIDYQELPSAGAGWRDGLHWFREVETWAEAYETKYMLPNEDSHTTAEFTVRILLWHIPHRFYEMGTKALTVLLDDRLRESMLYDAPPQIYVFVMKAILNFRKLLLRHLALPRPEALRIRNVADKADPKTGRYQYGTWTAHPWYVSKEARWRRDGLVTRLLPNGVLPGDDSDKYISEGYRIEEVGPRAMLGKGAEAMRLNKIKLETERTGGCPFAFA